MSPFFTIFTFSCTASCEQVESVLLPVGDAVGWLFAFAEEERNAPDSRDGYKNVDCTGSKASCASKHPGNQVKLENSDETPVDSADNKQDECDFVPHE